MPKTRWETHIEPYLIDIVGWARRGVIDKDIAQNLGVAYSTLRKYKKEKPELEEALKESKEHSNIIVESALFKRAVGYQLEEKKTVKKNGKVVEETTVTKEIPPDVTAQKFWLQNREAENWAEKQSVEISRPIDESVAEMEAYFAGKKETDT